MNEMEECKPLKISIEYKIAMEQMQKEQHCMMTCLQM